ncbi:hypothetical protein [Clostridium algidicarnis]|uniref:hypothetical protein n=1 Tax=Clostridium algidicarnis TaxID=37659 RepID=UPI000A78186A|nr:hypothetical protein [Clostridium algidicarnis]
MNNIREKLVSTILAATIIAGITIPSTKVLAATSTEFNQAKDLVTFAKKQRNFAEYNIAYQAILKVKDEQQQNQLLSELAPLWNEVVTKDVKASLDIITIVANKLELKSYDEALSYIEKEVKNDRNSQYLKGELTSWGRAGVYTSDVTKAVDSIIRVWNEKTEQAENDAKGYISKVVKAENRTYLTAQLKEASTTIVKVPKAINEANDTNSMHKALLSMNLNDYLKVPIEDRTIIADEVLKSRPNGTGYTSVQAVVLTLQKLTNEATGTYTLAVQGVNDLSSKSTTEEVTNALLKVKNEEFNAMTKEVQRVIANSFKSKLVFNQAGTALKTPFITLRLVQSLMK